MKFAHLADTHLGYRQFGLIEREKDFYEVFEKIIDKIIEEKVDFVIHSGDLFESAKPSPNALLVFQKGLLKLKGAGIPMYSIAGNHDSIMRKGSIPPHVLFKKFGLKVISPINTNYVHDGEVFIGGLPFYPSSKNKNIKLKLDDLSSKAKEYSKSILVLHQGIDKYLPFQYELEIGDIPDNFNYYALGHIHNYINDDFGKGKLVYPGSTDIWKSDELADYRKNGKGFCIVDLTNDKPDVKRITINISREFVTKIIDYSDFTSSLLNLKTTIKDFEKKPILNITVNNIEKGDTTLYERINEEIGDYYLLIRPKFSTGDELDEKELILTENNSLGPRELLYDSLKNYENEDINNLAIDLYDSLSKDQLENSEKIIDEFYNLYFEKIDIDSIEEDVQTKFKGGL